MRKKKLKEQIESDFCGCSNDDMKVKLDIYELEPVKLKSAVPTGIKISNCTVNIYLSGDKDE